MAKTSRLSARSAQDDAVRAAITRAEKQAGEDDREFVRALNKHVRAALQGPPPAIPQGEAQ